MLKNQQVTPGARLWLVFALVAVGALGLDLWTKQWVWDTLRAGGRPWMVIDPWLELAFAYNQGSAFGLVRKMDFPIGLLLLTLLMIGWVVVVGRSPGAGRVRMIGCGLVVGGALGNLHDRWLRVDELGRHGVVDFIKVNYPWGGSWPSFNVADAALVVGALLLAWSLRERGVGGAPAPST